MVRETVTQLVGGRLVGEPRERVTYTIVGGDVHGQ